MDGEGRSWSSENPPQSFQHLNGEEHVGSDPNVVPAAHQDLQVLQIRSSLLDQSLQGKYTSEQHGFGCTTGFNFRQSKESTSGGGGLFAH